MNERQKFILRAALIYAQSNVDDINEAFDQYGPNDPRISVNGKDGEKITEDDIENLVWNILFKIKD